MQSNLQTNVHVGFHCKNPKDFEIYLDHYNPSTYNHQAVDILKSLYSHSDRFIDLKPNVCSSAFTLPQTAY